LAQQTHAAALLVNNLKHRIRTRFPYPVAFRWRTVEASHPNLEGYTQVLACAEVVICYAAIMAIVMAKNQKMKIEKLSEMAQNLSSNPGRHGTSMGDWVALLREVSGSKTFRNLPSSAPFFEVTQCLQDKEVNDALQRLSDKRNDNAHDRGPKGSAVQKCFQEAVADLELMLKGFEFLSDYPLRYIEATRRDTILKVTNYDYRELMGDHALVPLATADNSEAELEVESLYLVDRAGCLQLLRPFLTGRDCPMCGSWGTFYLDKFGKDKLTSHLKSMEHGHTFPDEDITPAMKICGLLL
jgi:hypothetical protein